MDKKEANSRLEMARKRTESIHLKIGKFSSYFAGLELQLYEMLAKCLNPSEPNRPEIVLSQLSFGQSINALNQYVKKYYDDPEIIKQLKDIVTRLKAIATERNEIIHSSWIAYSTGDYGQHRARSKGGKAAGLHEHNEDPANKVSELIEKIDETLFDLICFEDLIIENNSEPGA